MKNIHNIEINLPAYHCQSCGACIGYLGVWFQKFTNIFHTCPPEGKRYIDKFGIDNPYEDHVNIPNITYAFEYIQREDYPVWTRGNFLGTLPITDTEAYEALQDVIDVWKEEKFPHYAIRLVKMSIYTEYGDVQKL